MSRQVVLVVMDGVGKSTTGLGDAVTAAHTPTLDKLLATCKNVYIKAHGTAVGLPSDEDMGNSEVKRRNFQFVRVAGTQKQLRGTRQRNAFSGAFVRRQRTQQHKPPYRAYQGREKGRHQKSIRTRPA